MSVYKEIQSIINNIHHACTTTQIWNDSADSGLPVTIDVGPWKNISYWLQAHAIQGTRKRPYQNAHQLTISVIEEHTTKDTVYYEVTYHTNLTNKQNLIQACDGYYTIRKVMPSERELINDLHRLEYDMMYPNGEPDETHSIHPDIDPAGGYGLASHV